jgi:hypothetical protein
LQHLEDGSPVALRHREMHAAVGGARLGREPFPVLPLNHRT